MNGKDGRTSETEFWWAGQRGCTLRLESGDVVRGKITYVSEYTIGFIPAGDHKGSELERLGMETRKESMLFKGFIRVMTPKEAHTSERPDHGRKPKRRSPAVQRL